jgi:hypothetical protein
VSGRAVCLSTGDIVVQGDALTDARHLTQLRDLGVKETAGVEIVTDSAAVLAA